MVIRLLPPINFGPLDWLGGAVGAVGSLGSSFVSAYQSSKNVKDQIAAQREENAINRKFNSSEAEKARQFSLDMFNRTNEYNSPSQQMERYRQAGLNPNLIYGQNGIPASAPSSANSASSSSSISPVGFEPFDATPAANIAADTALKQAQARKLNTDADTGEIENKYLPMIREGDIRLQGIEYSLKESLKNLNGEQQKLVAKKVEETEENINYIIAGADTLRAQGRLMDSQRFLNEITYYVRNHIKDAEIQNLKNQFKITEAEALYHIPMLLSQIGLNYGLASEANQKAANEKYWRENQAFWETRGIILRNKQIVVTLPGLENETNLDVRYGEVQRIIDSVGSAISTLYEAALGISAIKNAFRPATRSSHVTTHYR